MPTHAEIDRKEKLIMYKEINHSISRIHFFQLLRLNRNHET